MTYAPPSRAPRLLASLEILAHPYLFALLVGSLLLTTASFYTTYVGLLQFMPQEFIAFCIVLSVQALLFVTSWRIGFAVADRDAPPLFTIAIFLICLATSVFFSWAALFHEIHDDAARERTRAARAAQTADAVAAELAVRQDEAARDAFAAVQRAPAYALWARDVEEVGRLALEARDGIDARLRQSQLALGEEIAALERRREALAAEGESARLRRAAEARKLERAEAARAAALARAEAADAAVVAAREALIRKEAEMAAEERGGAVDRAAGRGPVWRRLRAERERLAAELAGQERLAAEAEGALSGAEEAVDLMKAAFAAAPAGGAGAQMAALDAEIARLRQRIGAGVGALGGGIGGQVEQLRRDLASFATLGALPAYEAAALRCGDLLQAMRDQPAIAARGDGLRCERPELTRLLAPVRGMAEGRAALQAACAAPPSSAGFEAAVSAARACVAAAGLAPAATADLSARLARLSREEGEGASRFVQALNAWREGDKLAYLALAIALFIDLLVLFCGLIGAVSTVGGLGRHLGPGASRATRESLSQALTLRLDDPKIGEGAPQLAMARELLGALEPYAGDRRMLANRRERRTALARISRISAARQAAARHFLVELAAKGFAQPIASADGSVGERFALSSAAVDAVRAECAAAAEVEPARGAEPGAETRPAAPPPPGLGAQVRGLLPAPRAAARGAQPLALPPPEPAARPHGDARRRDEDDPVRRLLAGYRAEDHGRLLRDVMAGVRPTPAAGPWPGAGRFIAELTPGEAEGAHALALALYAMGEAQPGEDGVYRLSRRALGWLNAAYFEAQSAAPLALPPAAPAAPAAARAVAAPEAPAAPAVAASDPPIAQIADGRQGGDPAALVAAGERSDAPPPTAPCGDAAQPAAAQEPEPEPARAAAHVSAESHPRTKPFGQWVSGAAEKTADPAPQAAADAPEGEETPPAVAVAIEPEPELDLETALARARAAAPTTH